MRFTFGLIAHADLSALQNTTVILKEAYLCVTSESFLFAITLSFLKLLQQMEGVHTAY